MLRTQLKTISVSPLEEFRFNPANQEARSRGDNERRACPRGTNHLRSGELHSNNREILFKASKEVGQDHACLPTVTDLKPVSLFTSST